MRNALVIFKKEMKRFFFDTRMLLAMFLPGIIIFAMYTFLGKMMAGNVFSNSIKDTTYQIVYTSNYSTDPSTQPKLLSFVDNYLAQENQNNKATYTKISKEELPVYKAKLQNKECDLIISYSDNFENALVLDGAKNNVSLYYNGETTESSKVYSVVSGLIGSAYNKYTINIDLKTNQYDAPDVGKSNAMLNKVVSFILPMVTVSLLYGTIASFCPESISGEKERGTLASMLLTPIKRRDFVFGKIMALFLVAIISGTVSFMGLISSMPGMFGMTSLPFSVMDVVLLFAIIVTTLLFFVGFGVLVSALSNTVKEASSYLGPLSVLFMALSLIPVFLNGSNIGFAFIPIVNLSSSISALISQSPDLSLFFVLTSLSNIVYCGLFVFLITKIFNKEKVVLGK